MKTRTSFLILGTLAALLAACDDDGETGRDAAVVDGKPDGSPSRMDATVDAPWSSDGSTDATADARLAPGTLVCGARVCPGSSFLGLVSLPACCAGSDEADPCGLDLRPAASLAPVPMACVRPARPGIANADCPSVPSPSPLYGNLPLQGCCRPNHTCGVFVKAGALDLGCADLSGFVDDAGAPQSCGTGDGGGAL